MKINRKVLGIFLGLSLVSTFVVIANARDGVEISKKETQTVLKDRENMVKPNNFDSGEKIEAEIKIDGVSNKISDGENSTTEKDLVNYVMVMSKVLYDNGLLSEEILDGFLDEFKGANNLKLCRDEVLSVRGEENYKKLKDVVAKTNFKDVKLNEEHFKQTIEKIKKFLFKEKNKVEGLCSKIKEAFDKNDEKALVKCQNMRERDIILQRENKIKKNELTEKEKESAKGLIKKLKESIKNRTKEGKLDNFGKKLLLDLKNDYEKRYIPELKESIEKINEIKFEDVKDLHKKLKINRKVEKTEIKEKN